MDVVFRAQALADLRTVMAWYRDQGDSSEARIDAAFEEELAYMRRVPFGCQVRRSPYRFAMIEGYTYFIIYAVVKETLVIHRIGNMRQRPLKRYFGSGV